jgi:hypothetical protein
MIDPIPVVGNHEMPWEHATVDRPAEDEEDAPLDEEPHDSLSDYLRR